MNAPAAVPWTRRPAVLAGGAVGLLAFGVLLGVLVVKFTGPAPPPMDGGSGMGGMPGMGSAPGSSGTGTSAPLPGGTLAGMLRAAHASLDAGRREEAMTAYQAVLRREPDNVEALSHAGLILGMVGHTDQALASLDRALAVDPRNTHALWDKARILQEVRQDHAGAIATWERFVALTPDGPDRVQALARIREAKARLASPPDAPAPAGAGAAHPPSPAGRIP